MVNYKEAKNTIFRNKVKWLGVCIVWMIPAGIGAALGFVKAGVDWTTKKCDNWAQSYEDETQEIRTEAEAQKVRENNQWKEDLKRDERTDKEVRGGDSGFCLIM